MKYICIRLQYFIISNISTASSSTKKNVLVKEKKNRLGMFLITTFFVVVLSESCSVMFKKRALSKRVPLAKLIQEFRYYGKNTS